LLLVIHRNVRNESSKVPVIEINDLALYTIIHLLPVTKRKVKIRAMKSNWQKLVTDIWGIIVHLLYVIERKAKIEKMKFQWQKWVTDVWY